MKGKLNFAAMVLCSYNVFALLLGWASFTGILFYFMLLANLIGSVGNALILSKNEKMFHKLAYYLKSKGLIEERNE